MKDFLEFRLIKWANQKDDTSLIKKMNYLFDCCIKNIVDPVVREKLLPIKEDLQVFNEASLDQIYKIEAELIKKIDAIIEKMIYAVYDELMRYNRGQKNVYEAYEMPYISPIAWRNQKLRRNWMESLLNDSLLVEKSGHPIANIINNLVKFGSQAKSILSQDIRKLNDAAGIKTPPSVSDAESSISTADLSKVKPYDFGGKVEDPYSSTSTNATPNTSYSPSAHQAVMRNARTNLVSDPPTSNWSPTINDPTSKPINPTTAAIHKAIDPTTNLVDPKNAATPPVARQRIKLPGTITSTPTASPTASVPTPAAIAPKPVVTPQMAPASTPVDPVAQAKSIINAKTNPDFINSLKSEQDPIEFENKLKSVVSGRGSNKKLANIAKALTGQIITGKNPQIIDALKKWHDERDKDSEGAIDTPMAVAPTKTVVDTGLAAAKKHITPASDAVVTNPNAFIVSKDNIDSRIEEFCKKNNIKDTKEMMLKGLVKKLAATPGIDISRYDLNDIIKAKDTNKASTVDDYVKLISNKMINGEIPIVSRLGAKPSPGGMLKPALEPATKPSSEMPSVEPPKANKPSPGGMLKPVLEPVAAKKAPEISLKKNLKNNSDIIQQFVDSKHELYRDDIKQLLNDINSNVDISKYNLEDIFKAYKLGHRNRLDEDEMKDFILDKIQNGDISKNNLTAEVPEPKIADEKIGSSPAAKIEEPKVEEKPTEDDYVYNPYDDVEAADEEDLKNRTGFRGHKAKAQDDEPIEDEENESMSAKINILKESLRKLINA